MSCSHSTSAGRLRAESSLQPDGLSEATATATCKLISNGSWMCGKRCSRLSEPPVWPFVEGKVRGYSFAPLYKHAATAALRDPKLFELLGLADALRDGRIRERKIAMDELGKRILHYA